jgi:methylisocitrate lyase
MDSLRKLIGGTELITAPVALNPMMARLGEAAGFRALYLSGGSLGWLKCVTEANLALAEMVQVGVDIRTICKLPLILDAAGGWGDPMHMHRTIAMSEITFAGIEIEDQLLPKRAHHHVGIEHTIPQEMMVAKIEEAVAARSDPEFVIIARTDAGRTHDLDEALKRADAYKKAGADMLFVYSHNPDELRRIGERLPPPLMMFAPAEGFARFALSARDLTGLGFRVAAAPVPAYAAMHKAVRQSFAALVRGEPDPLLGPGGAAAEMKLAQATAGLEILLEIERRTTERR